MKTAFKEWAVVCDALARGEQIVVLRKGGIVEEHGRFLPAHPRFVLLPTYLHQSAEGVVPSRGERLRRIQEQAPPEDVVVLTHWAEATAAVEVRSLAALQAIRDEHVWSDAVVTERFRRWQTDSVYALTLRTYRLAETVTLPMRPEYGGCKSWIELDRYLEPNEDAPVLSDEEFQVRAQRVLQATARREVRGEK